MSDEQKSNPLHGVTLEMILNRLVDFYGWEKLGKHIDMNCFNNDPSIKSCLKFLRKTPWAREKVEGFYLYYGNPPWRNKQMKNHPFQIIVTDSGLGGLSVAAKIEREIREKNIPGEFEIIFYNSLPYSKFGYNLIERIDDRIKLFDSALNGMVEHFNPDLIVLACNTLSVLFPKTKFSREKDIPICGIIEPGIEILNKRLTENKNSAAIILGTETTVFSNTHKNLLVSFSVEPERIINQPCDYLESEIQVEPEGTATKELITKFTGRAINAAGQKFEKLYFALCCTHYQYSKNVFHQIISNLIDQPFEIIDPNEFLVKDVLQFANKNSKPDTKNSKVRSRVVCKFEIPKNEIEILSPLLEKESTYFAEAFRKFDLNKELFVFPV